MFILPVAVAGLAGCSQASGQSATASASQAAAKAASANGVTAAKLKGALLTQVNGVAAAGPASSGKYSSVSQAGKGKLAASGVQVTPKTCAGTATEGFNPAVLAGEPAAAVSFAVGKNGISEVLIGSSAQAASTALAGHVPTECAQYKATLKGKTYTYSVKEQPVTGVGAQAEALNVHAAGPTSENLWSLIYRGTGFVGTVTVVGPNASEKAVQELGKQAYAYAAKRLA
jgi:hypothetical protein